jgi:hypothetical protein
VEEFPQVKISQDPLQSSSMHLNPPFLEQARKGKMILYCLGSAKALAPDKIPICGIRIKASMNFLPHEFTEPNNASLDEELSTSVALSLQVCFRA